MAARAQKFFSTTKKGENFELKAELNSEYKDKRKEAVKKVIANMTIGKDVSSLFADVVKNMQTEDLELKKLVYLYLINYARTQPELVILAVNTFVKDTDDVNPLIRALAIRTMGLLRVERIIDYLLEPLKKGLRDEDPYVRKTAALCVAKLFDLSPSIAMDNGLVAIVQEMLSDRNPMVIANAVAALAEISGASVKKDVFVVNNTILTKLLAAINECTEWGQICILNSLASYRPNDAREAREIVERVIPRLQHANASVVMNAVKVLMIYLNYVNDEDTTKQIIRKLAPPLVTLLSSEPELQYVALRNINLILQKRPDVLNQEMRVFFTKYNDPPYVKYEKLEVIIKLASDKNVDQVLSELKEYANEVDVDFVRKSVRAIGRCAVKIDSAAEKCINVLLDLIKTKVNYVVQEAIIVIKDIFRKYPQRYEGIIPALCENLDTLDEPEAKASLIWIIGEYADRIENADELLEHFLESFKDENALVQLQLVSAAVKLFLKKPGSAQELVQRAVVLSEKPPIEADNATVSESLLDELIHNIATLASVYHKSPSLLGGTTLDVSTLKGETTLEMEAEEPEVDARTVAQQVNTAVGGGIENLLDLDFGGPSTSTPVPGGAPSSLTPQKSNIDDLLGLMDSEPAVSTPPFGTPTSGFGGFDFGRPAGASGQALSFPKESLLTSANAQGLELQGAFARKNNQPYLELTFANRGGAPMSDFAIQFNVNSFGIAPAAALQVPSPLAPGASADVLLPLNTSGGVQQMEPRNLIQIAVKNNVGVYYFQMMVPDGVVKS
ncbi:hypothetical protein HDV00_002909 [Rhizophlyctis rosea]|nr:hypothetical protein HDV00_002909 [Rhizophlyctis rosea]